MRVPNRKYLSERTEGPIWRLREPAGQIPQSLRSLAIVLPSSMSPSGRTPYAPNAPPRAYPLHAQRDPRPRDADSGPPSP